MVRTLSPLRYPGGKSKIYKNIKKLIVTNGLGNKTYIEPFAGGFGVGLALLNEGIIQSAVINDYDSHIFNFWNAVLNHTEELIQLVQATPITIEERARLKSVYESDKSNVLEDGFATLFLNRVNYSGVIFGGPLGGYEQKSQYKLDCRFNKEDIIKRIRNVASYSRQIELYNFDAGEFLLNMTKKAKEQSFFNIDPPYVVKGSSLYTNFFVEADHRKLKETIDECLREVPWIITYDDCDLIREIYDNYEIKEYSIQHSAHHKVIGKELIISNLSNEHFVW